MTARTVITSAAAVALAAGPVGGQDKDVVQWYESRTGLLWTGFTSVKIETVDQALELLATALNVNVANGPVRDIMAGDLLALTEAERNDLADRLGEMILADTTEGERVAEHASGTLREASEIHGHAHSFDVLVRTYERTVALGLHDRVHLGSIESADPVRGRAYVLGVFEAAEAPPDCFRDAWHREAGDTRPDCMSNPFSTTFCRAGAILYSVHVRKRLKDPEIIHYVDAPQSAYEAVGLEPNAARWWDRCWGM